MFDAVNTLVAGFHEYGDKDDDEEDYGFVLQIETDTEYWPVIYDNLRDFGKEVATETENGNIIVAPIEPEDKESVLEAFTDIGFVAKKATDEDIEELIRELDKLSTIKGGESKKYKGKKGT
jgi:hypothetical protein